MFYCVYVYLVWISYKNDLAAKSLERWLVRGITPQTALFQIAAEGTAWEEGWPFFRVADFLRFIQVYMQVINGIPWLTDS